MCCSCSAAGSWQVNAHAMGKGSEGYERCNTNGSSTNAATLLHCGMPTLVAPVGTCSRSCRLRTTTMAVVCALLGSSVSAIGVQTLTAPDAAAQGVPDTVPIRWHGSAETSGTILYGAANQRVFAAGASASRMHRDYELRLDLQGSYGDSRNQNTGVRSVIARSVRLSGAYDLHPHDRISPFALVSAESNYQQRYKSRVSAGVGAKYTLWRPDSVVGGFVQDASISLAILAENTTLLDNAPANSKASAGKRARWSLRMRYRKRINDNIRFSHVTLYQPTVNGLNRYTLDAITELAVPLRTRLQLTIAHRERLDSEAVRRGANSIRDGQVVFGVRATF